VPPTTPGQSPLTVAPPPLPLSVFTRWACLKHGLAFVPPSRSSATLAAAIYSLRKDFVRIRKMRGSYPADECDPLQTITICALADATRRRAVDGFKAHALNMARRVGLDPKQLRVAFVSHSIFTSSSASVIGSFWKYSRSCWASSTQLHPLSRC
jgi:hypothetical protein